MRHPVWLRIDKIIPLTLFILLHGVSADPSCLWAVEDRFAGVRRDMVSEQIRDRGVKDERVLEAMLKVKRHLFVDVSLAAHAYEDRPLSIGYGQTISQPYIVAYMTEAARLKESDRVLEIGTGSGYQAAILAEMVKEVYTIEIVEPLAKHAKGLLDELGYKNITVKHGDGYQGWPEAAPFDAIIVTAAPESIPEKLVEQLGEGGRMVIPVGSFFQHLYVMTKTSAGIQREEQFPVRFVPMVEGA